MENTNIEWCDSTINPTSGCDGCELYRPGKDGSDEQSTCYAKDVHLGRLARSLPALYAPRFDHVRMIPGRMIKAAKWPDLRGEERPDKPWLNGRPRHIFVGDMGDFLSEAVTDEFIKSEIIAAIESKVGQRHVWQLLTKRPERLADISDQLGGLPDNVIAMTTVTNQRTAEIRVPNILRVRCKTRGLSIEPMLGSVDLTAIKQTVAPGYFGDCLQWYHRGYRQAEEFDYPSISWVICGGESGRGARPMHPGWARSLRDQCAAAGVLYFWKQWGEWLPDTQRRFTTSGDISWGLVHETGRFRAVLTKGKRAWDQSPAWGGGEEGTTHVGKKAAGRLLDGREHNAFPEVLT